MVGVFLLEAIKISVYLLIHGECSALVKGLEQFLLC